MFKYFLEYTWNISYSKNMGKKPVDGKILNIPCSKKQKKILMRVKIGIFHIQSREEKNLSEEKNGIFQSK